MQPPLGVLRVEAPTCSGACAAHPIVLGVVRMDGVADEEYRIVYIVIGWRISARRVDCDVYKGYIS